MAHFFQNGFFGGGFPGGFPGEDGMDEEQKDVDTDELYNLLGCDKSATKSEITKAYRTLAKKAHPDKGGDADKFKEINMAYEILGNEEKRKTYDKYGLEGIKEGGGPGGGFEDIFGHFFGGGRGRPGHGQQGQKKTKPMEKRLEVSLEDLYNGKVVKLPINKRVCCEECSGKGGKNVKTCTDCKGQGFKIKTQMLGPGMIQQSQVPCNLCRGEGKMMDEKDKCKICKGEKIKSVDKILEIPVDKGCPSGKVILMHGEGNEMPGAMAGDLHVGIIVKDHPVFKREGADLYMNKKVTLLEALTGVNFKLKHLEGNEVTICTAPGDVISSDSMKVVQGKGMPFYKDTMSCGNLMIKFEVVFPESGALNKENIEMLKKSLPGPKVPPPPKNYEMMEDFHDGLRNQNAEGGKRRSAEEDEQGGHGGHRVECGNQ